MVLYIGHWLISLVSGAFRVMKNLKLWKVARENMKQTVQTKEILGLLQAQPMDHMVQSTG